MMKNAKKEWVVSESTDDSDDIPLWKALAQFTSYDLDEGLTKNAAIINQAKAPFLRGHNVAVCVSFFFLAMSIIFLPFMLALARSEWADVLFVIELILIAAAVAPFLWRYVYQYGWKVADEALELPHATNEYFERFMDHLQKVSGPQAYYISRFSKKRKPLNRRQLFGKLRYFLFSEHSSDRRMVMHSRFGRPLPSDIYINGDDLKKMAKPKKRKGGAGVYAKYPYEDAIIAVLTTPGITQLDLGDRAGGIDLIKGWIVDWLHENSDEEGSSVTKGYPRVIACAEKIYACLENFSGDVSRIDR